MTIRSGMWKLSEKGSAAVEFAIGLPVLVMILVGIVDYAQVVGVATELHSAARAGAQYAIKYPNDVNGIQTAATNAVSDPNMNTPTVTQFCTCGSSTAAATAWATCKLGTQTCTGTTLRYYVTVSTSQTFTPSPDFVYHGLGGSVTMAGSATVQVQ